MRNLLFVFLLSFSVSVSAQRMTIIEHFSNASCSNCGVYTPQIVNYADTSPNVVQITWHIRYPYTWDSIYHDNPSLMDWRMNFYGIFSAPRTTYEGNASLGYIGSPVGFLSNGVNKVAGRTAMAKQMTVSNKWGAYRPDSSKFLLDFDLQIPMSADSGSYRLHTWLIERAVGKNDYQGPAGNNSEQVYHNVARSSFYGDTGLSVAVAFNRTSPINIFPRLSMTEQEAKILNKKADNVFAVIVLQDIYTKEIVDVDTVEFVQPSTNGLLSHKQSAKLEVFPNPASDYIYLSLESNKTKGDLLIMDLLGREAKQIPANFDQNGEMRLDISVLRPGMYMLSFVNEEGRLLAMEPIIVE